MADKPEPIWVNGLRINEHTFANSGSILKVGINVDAFIAFIQANRDGDWCNIILSRMKNPKPNQTHYSTLDTWKPGARSYTGEPRQQSRPAAKPARAPNDNYANPPSDPEADDVPF